MKKVNITDEDILKLTEDMPEAEMKVLVENLKRKIFAGGITEINPEKKEAAVERYFNIALGIK